MSKAPAPNPGATFGQIKTNRRKEREEVPAWPAWTKLRLLLTRLKCTILANLKLVRVRKERWVRT
jgi:hypothetical protein